MFPNHLNYSFRVSKHLKKKLSIDSFWILAMLLKIFPAFLITPKNQSIAPPIKLCLHLKVELERLMSKVSKKKKYGHKKPGGVPHFLLKTYEIIEVSQFFWQKRAL
jgi:hypothetical protein